MEKKINQLDDKTAINIMSIIAQNRLRSGSFETELTPEITQALTSAFDSSPASAETVSEGELARQALLLLAQDPEYQAPVSALINGPKTKTFTDPVTTIAVITVALVILQTHIKFERDKNGKMSILIEKKPTSEELLKPLIEKFLGLFSSGMK